MNLKYLKLIPSILTLMSVAEQVGGPGTGAEKKEAVKAGVKAISYGMTAASGGGQKETWAQIDGMIDWLSPLF